jgi:DoxX-like protein
LSFDQAVGGYDNEIQRVAVGGLIVPWLLRIRPGLTPLAACGLVIIMIGATAITVMSNGVAQAVVPCIVGVLSASVAYGRWQLMPSVGSSHLRAAEA